MSTGTLGKLREALGGAADVVGRLKSGSFVARRGFFYTHGYTAEKFEARVKELAEKAGFTVTIVESYEKWTPFRGGTSVSASSHWGVIFKVEEPSAEERARVALGTSSFSL
jgi:hypothetical protein